MMVFYRSYNYCCTYSYTYICFIIISGIEALVSNVEAIAKWQCNDLTIIGSVEQHCHPIAMSNISCVVYIHILITIPVHVNSVFCTAWLEIKSKNR